jgi:Ca-activated chloride channel homolog
MHQMAISSSLYLAFVFTLALLVLGPTVTVYAQTTTPAAVDEVVLYFNVTDKYGRFVSGLSTENFKIQDGKSFHDITSFGFEDAPVSVGFLIDNSGSAEYLTEFAFDSLSHFMKACAAGSDFFVMTFATQPRLLVDWKGSGTEVMSELRGLTIKTKGGTTLFDAIDRGIAKVGAGSASTKALIVFSDGLDSASKVNFKEVKRKLSDSDVILYSVSLGESSGLRTMHAVQAVQSMSELTEMTGGRTLLPTMDRFFELVSQTAAELRYQYRIGFRPKPATNGKQTEDTRKIEVKVVDSPELAKKMGKLTIHRRSGFYMNGAKAK